MKYQVETRKTPHTPPEIVGRYRLLTEARRATVAYRDRADLCRQDVRIDRLDGKLVEYAGPCR